MLSSEIALAGPTTMHRPAGTLSRMAKLYLKEWRERAELNQTEAGERVGLSHAQISRLETGRQDPPLSRLVKLAKAYGAPGPAYLFVPPGEGENGGNTIHLDRSALYECLEEFFDLLDARDRGWNSREKAEYFISMYKKTLRL